MIFYLILFYLILSYPIPSYSILSYPILSHPVLSYPILSYPILSYPILSYPILSYPFLSYLVMSCHVISLYHLISIFSFCFYVVYCNLHLLSFFLPLDCISCQRYCYLFSPSPSLPVGNGGRKSQPEEQPMMRYL